MLTSSPRAAARFQAASVAQKAFDLVRSGRWRTDIALIVVSWLIVFVPFAGFVSLYHEEGTHAGLAKDMLLRHRWLAPQLAGAIPYYNKPPMLPWLMAASAQVTGGFNEWAVRIPSLLAALSIAIPVYWVLRPVVTQRAALTGAAIALLTVSVMKNAAVGETEQRGNLVVANADG
jgi:4-amino-4-deoxy-L-arabinose transferase-like glycosyltransferase